MSTDLLKENLTKSTYSGFAWQYISYISQAILQILVLAVLARLLSPEDFGVLGLAMIVVGFAALFSQLGVGPALVQRSELTLIHIRVGFSLSILLSLILTLITIAVSPLAALFLQSNRVTSVLSVVSLNFLFAGFGVVAESLLKRNLQFKKLMWASVGSYLFGYAIVGIGMAWLGYGVWSLVGATLGQSLVNSILLLLLNPHSLLPSLARREIRELLFFGGGFTLARFLNYSANQGDYFMVGRMMGPGPLGIYSRAYQLMMMPAKYFSEVLSVVLFPVMAKLQDERQRLAKTYLTAISMVSLVSAPIGVFMIITAPEIVEVLLGPKWSEVIIPFQILSIGVVARGSYKMDDTLAKALGVMYRRSVRDAIYAAAVLLGAWSGLKWGLTGVAVGVLAAVLINYILAVRMSMDLLDCTLLQVIQALLPSIYPTTVVAVLTLFTRSLLHMYGFPAWFTLVTISVVAGISLIGVFLLQPQILGVYGIKTLKRFIPLLPIRIFPKTVSQWLLTRIKSY